MILIFWLIENWPVTLFFFALIVVGAFFAGRNSVTMKRGKQ